MVHRNARLTVHGRLLLIERVVVEGRPVAHVAPDLGISRATGYKWLARWRAEGPAGLLDRSSRPHTSPTRTDPVTEAQIVALRRDQRLGPARIAGVVTLNPSTVHRVLVRRGMQRLASGIARIERVMTDNARAYRRSAAWRHALAALGATAKFTRRYRPQTNGKAERFNRTLAEEWAYRAPFNSSTERTAALPRFLHAYNMHRAHTALGGKPPISRAPVNNLTGHYI